MPRSPTPSTRQVVIAALAMVVIGAVGAVQAGLAGADFMYDLEQTQPALARVPPVVGDPQTPRLARRVYLVIADGLRFDKSYGLPFLDELRRKGADLEAASHYPTYSRPNYVSILTGVPPVASGVRTNHHHTPVTLDSLMDRVHAAGMRTAAATDYEVLPKVFLRSRSARATDPELNLDPEPDEVVAADADLVSPFDDARYAPWPGGFMEAGIALADRDADLVVLLVGAADAAGHAKGGKSEEYAEATRIVDRALRRVLEHADLTLDAIVITADHGHTDRGGHGGLEPEVVSVPLILAGAGTVTGSPVATSPPAQLIDIAPTVSALLGIPAPGHGLGRTLVELLALDDAAKAARRGADATRLVATTSTVARASARASGLVLEHRTRRIAFVVGGALAAIVFAIVGLRRRVLHLDLGVLFTVVPAFFVVYFGLIGTLGQRFSPSLLPANAHMAGQLAKYGIVAVAVQMATSMWALRGKATLADRLAEANGIAWVGLMLTIVPAGMLWALFPPPYDDVPGPVLLVMIPAIEVAVAAAAAGVALMLAIELIVFGSRALRPKD